MVLMHMRGRPEEWRTLPPPGDIVLTVKRRSSRSGQKQPCWRECGGSASRSIPASASEKTSSRTPCWLDSINCSPSGSPLLAGTSRKSFLGRTLARDGKDAGTQDRLYGTLATHTALILKGAHILRTHDVKAAVDAARVTDEILQSR